MAAFAILSSSSFAWCAKGFANAKSCCVLCPTLRGRCVLCSPLTQTCARLPDSPAARILARCMPWLKGRRPAWMIRLGLLIYDSLGGRKLLPGTTRLRLSGTAEGQPLKTRYQTAYEYSDCWVQDSRLVVLNARDAAARGARIESRTRFTGADRHKDWWRVRFSTPDGAEQSVTAHALVNAAGPWVSEVGSAIPSRITPCPIRLVRGSHIVTKKLFGHGKCYLFQGADGRIVFAIPYENDFTLIGTTEHEHANADDPAECTQEEAKYLRECVSAHLRSPVAQKDILWAFSGVRPLIDNEASTATAASRDFLLELDDAEAPLLSVYGGKITTYRILAEQVLAKLARFFPSCSGAWTAAAPLPGGDFPVDGTDELVKRLSSRHAFLNDSWAKRLISTYGTEAFQIFKCAENSQDIPRTLGADISEAELAWAVQNEWVRTADDFLWRRTRLGLRVTEAEREMAEQFISGMLRGNAAVLPAGNART